MGNNVRKVEKFVADCNDMLSGRFLDFNKKVDNIFRSMTESEDILSFLTNNISDIDGEEVFESAFIVDSKTKNGKLSLPSEEKERIALFVYVISEISSRKLNSNKFLETYFRGGQGTPTQMFLNKIIEPLKNMIADFFKVDKNLTLAELNNKPEEEETFEEEEEDDELNYEEEYTKEDALTLALNNVIRVCDEIVAKLKFERKHEGEVEDFNFMLSALKRACELKDMLIVNGLILGINCLSRKIKSTNYLVNELNEIVYNIYQTSAEN